MTRAELAAYKAMIASQNPTSEIRIALTDAEALALVAEVPASDLRHPEAVAVGAAALSAVPPPPSVDNPDALGEWAKVKADASTKFWDALAGEAIDGVVVIRKRTY